MIESISKGVNLNISIGNTVNLAINIILKANQNLSKIVMFATKIASNLLQHKKAPNYHWRTRKEEFSRGHYISDPIIFM